METATAGLSFLFTLENNALAKISYGLERDTLEQLLETFLERMINKTASLTDYSLHSLHDTRDLTPHLSPVPLSTKVQLISK